MYQDKKVKINVGPRFRVSVAGRGIYGYVLGLGFGFGSGYYYVLNFVVQIPEFHFETKFKSKRHKDKYTHVESAISHNFLSSMHSCIHAYVHTHLNT
jgi:hypothetical protein